MQRYGPKNDASGTQTPLVRLPILFFFCFYLEVVVQSSSLGVRHGHSRIANAEEGGRGMDHGRHGGGEHTAICRS